MLVGVADDQIGARGGCGDRIGLRPAPRHHDARVRIPARRPADRLAIGELRARRHGAGVHDDEIGLFAERHCPEAALLEPRLHLVRIDLVQPTAERRERDRTAHAGTDSRSWPHAAPMSSPLLQRTVVVTPLPSRIAWKARMRASGDRRNVAPSQSLNGIKFTLARTPRSRRTSRRASSSESFTPSSITYSKKTRCRGASGYFFTASISVARFHDRFTGMSRERTSSDAPCSEIARFTFSSSRPSFSMPATSPTVDTVMRRGEYPTPSRASVKIRIAVARAA